MTPSALMNNYGTRSTTLVKGQGCYLWDNEGRRYLDAVSGIAVCGLGHSHPAMVDALKQQADTLIHVSNLYNIESQQRLAQKMCDHSGMEKAFFSNSGAEANEAALKLARLYARREHVDKPKVIVAHNSFHGRTLATLSATGNPKVQVGFEPLLEDFIHLEYNNIQAIKDALTTYNDKGNSSDEKIVAILLEPVQGEGGIQVPATNYLNQVRELCDQYQLLMMLDEIQTGNGRTGEYFAYQHNGILPDVLTTAKGLGNGLPIGACLASSVAADLFQPGNHGSTFGGNPLACRTAEAVLDTLIEEELISRAKTLGNSLLGRLHRELENCTNVTEVRGKGMMFGIELNSPCKELVEQAKDKGLLINVTADNVVRLLPPLIISQEQADTMVDTVCNLIRTRP